MWVAHALPACFLMRLFGPCVCHCNKNPVVIRSDQNAEDGRQKRTGIEWYHEDAHFIILEP
jgi:hypothetical protein